MSKCPVAHGFDPLSPTHFADPYTEFRRLHGEGPIVYLPEIDHYAVTRYEDVAAIMLDKQNISVANVQAPMMKHVEEAERILKEGFPRVPTFANADPPRHTQIRGATMRCLNMKRFRKPEPEIRRCAEGLVAGLVQEQVVDITEKLAFPLAGFAAGRLIGFPQEDLPQIEAWSEIWPVMTFGFVPPEEQVAGARAIVDFWNYADRFVTMRQQTPDDDLTSDLLSLSRDNPEALSRSDVLNIVFSMMLAAHDTTTMAITNAMYQLLVRPERWKALCAARSDIDSAVDELLRFDAPTVLRRRLVKNEIRIGGVTLPAGSKLMLLMGSANRDPDHFPAPDELDIHRHNAREHLSFGVGVHFCLGAPLARFEMKTVLELLTAAAPDMRLIEDQKLAYRASGTQHALKGLLVEPRPVGTGAA